MTTSDARLSVTATIAVRDGADLLPECLEAVGAQTRAPDEVLVVDGGSVDGSVDVARAAGARVIVQDRPGLPAAYNLLIAESRTDLVAFCSHDDLWTTDKLAVQISYLEAHPEVEFVHAHARFVAQPGFVPGPHAARLIGTERPAPIMETLVARRTVFDVVGGFDPEYTIAHDVDWLARVTAAGARGAMLTEVLLIKRLHGRNLSLQTEENNRQLLRAVRAAASRSSSQP